MKVFKVLKKIGAELSSYHGGSLDGTIMNNATQIFDQFAAIFKEGKMEGCHLMDADINLMCLLLGGLCFVGWSIFISKNNEFNE
jgi:hypothetical protein